MPNYKGEQDREKPMVGAELKKAYMKIFIKYSMKGIAMTSPTQLPIFKKNKQE